MLDMMASAYSLYAYPSHPLLPLVFFRVVQVMEMMPGGIGQMLNANLPPGQDSNAHFKRSMVIMDSMSKKEMACKVPMDEKRVFRIANGAGVHPQEVEKLMQMHAQFAKMITGMSKSGLLKGTDAQLSSKIGRNPNAVMSQLQKAIDPKMLQQMGGAGNFMEMLKQMGGGAGELVCGRWCVVIV